MSSDVNQLTVNIGRHPLSAIRRGAGSLGWRKHEYRIPEIRALIRDGLSYDGIAKLFGTERRVILRLVEEFDLQRPQRQAWFLKSFLRLPPILGNDRPPGMLPVKMPRPPKKRGPRTPSLAEALMTPITHGGPLRVCDIKRTVCERYAIALEELDGQSRAARFAHPRQLAMLLIRELTHLSTTAIGKALGGRDHTTIIYGLRAIRRRIRATPLWAEDYSALRAHLTLRPQNDDEASA